MEYQDRNSGDDALQVEDSGHLWKPRLRGSSTQVLSEISLVHERISITKNNPRTESDYISFVEFLQDTKITETEGSYVKESRTSRTSQRSVASLRTKLSRSIAGMQKLFSFGKSAKKEAKSSDATLDSSTETDFPSSLKNAHGASAPDIKSISNPHSAQEFRLSIKSEPSITTSVRHPSTLDSRTSRADNISKKCASPVQTPSVGSTSPIGKTVRIADTPTERTIPVSPRESLYTYHDFLRDSKPFDEAKKDSPRKPSLREPSLHYERSSKSEKESIHIKAEKKQVSLQTQSIQRGLSRSLSLEFENRVFETKRIESVEHHRSHTRHIVETNRIYAKKDQRNLIMSPTGKLEVSQGKVNQYHLFETIGTGSYGRVVLARDDVSDEFFACKIISKSRLLKKWRFQSFQKTLDMIRKEVAILKKVSNHPNIIKLYEVLDDSTDDNLYMFLEYCPNGPIMVLCPGQPAAPIPEFAALNYFRDIVLGLEYLHFNRIIHCDIKPENLLIDCRGVVQIGDFGISYILEDGCKDVHVIQNGTLSFTPPCALIEGVTKINGKAADIWALGVTLYCLTHGYCPFEGGDVFELSQKILKDKPKYSTSISKSVVDLMEGMLQKDAHYRFTMSKLKNHPWTTENGKRPMPSTEENCRRESITEADLEEAFKPAKLSMSEVLNVNKMYKRFWKPKKEQSLTEEEVSKSTPIINRPRTFN